MCTMEHYLILTFAEWRKLGIIIFSKIYFYLFERVTQREERQREREREREVFHPMVHSPIGLNGRGCTDLKPGARNFFQVSLVGAGAQALGPSSITFPGHCRELDWKRGSRD